MGASIEMQCLSGICICMDRCHQSHMGGLDFGDMGCSFEGDAHCSFGVDSGDRDCNFEVDNFCNKK